MILIKPDHSRRVNIPGVPNPVARPVDIDASTTGFSTLRTLRIYQFEEGSVIKGHAEEDEVFIVMLSGSIELTITGANSHDVLGPVNLSVPDGSEGRPCAAYLPPGAAYHLIAHGIADVAYARATPSSSKPAKCFVSSTQKHASGVYVLWEEQTYAQRLRIQLLQVHASHADVLVTPFDASETRCEGLVHVRNISPAGITAAIFTGEAKPTPLTSGDTLATLPGEQTTLRAPHHSSWLVLVVTAALDADSALPRNLPATPPIAQHL